MSDCDFFRPSSSPERFSQESPLVISYIGTIGFANGLKSILELAKAIESANLPVVIKVMGQGAEEKSLKAGVKNLGLTKVAFLPFGNHEKVRLVMDETQAVMISFLDLPTLHTGSPNKLFDALAAGKIVISNLQGWTKDIIENNKCGFYFHKRNTDSIVDKIQQLILEPQLLHEMQQNSRVLAEETFNKDVLLQKWMNEVISC